jgi:3'-phosphoadenosine 5'-phosphosulfate sulfotransferase (PAPS reductase)/FAD synthetase
VAMEERNAMIDLKSYDKYIVAFSGGKDSTACFLYLLEQGVPKEKIELWHHLVDGKDDLFMDWACTDDYCRKFAEAFDVPIYFSWKVGGFHREMTRQDSLTAPTQFETPSGEIGECGGKNGKLSTRMKFPQVSADLSVRWCSVYLKIDIGSSAIRNQERFNNSRTLVISGERGEESPARAKYAEFEVDRADNRTGRSRRHVDRWRPVRDWPESEVWAIIERHNVRVHPAYYLGFGRVSCLFCIFGNANQFATAAKVDTDRFIRICEYEEQFGFTIKRSEPLIQLASRGNPYKDSFNDSLLEQSRSREYSQEIFMPAWALPAGAYGESCGSV